METIERRRGFIINLMYYVSMLGLFYLFVKYAFWPLFPLIFAFFLAVVLQRPVDNISNKYKIKKGIVSVLMVLLVLFLIGLFIALLSNRVIKEFHDFIDYVSIRINDIDWIERTTRSFVAATPEFVQKSISVSVEEFLAELRLMMQEGVSTGSSPSLHLGSLNLKSLVFPSITGVWNTAKQIPSILIAVIITIISSCFMTSDYERISRGIKGLFPEDKRFMLSRTKAVLFSSLGKLGKAYLIIMLVTFSEMILGLSVMKIIGVYKGSYIFVIAVITALVDILPIFGTGSVLIPWGIYSIIVGDARLGVSLLILYGAITVIRQVVEPKLVASQLDLPPVATISAMYVGLQLFGIIGMFLLPITIFCLKILSDEGVINLSSLNKSGTPKTGKQEKEIQKI
ncbi:MAG: sporulation integral membrane protein YtvI [Acutalibacteraceae bacterium]